MYLFIDTNIYLSFYHFSQDDISELKKLSALIKARKITLLVTDQVKDEFLRNREVKIADALKYFKDTKQKQDFPRLVHEYTQYEELRKLQKEYDELYRSLFNDVMNDITSKNLAADHLINELFEIGETIIHSDKHMELAKNRVSIGSPPGKNGSLGDALNWEMLIEYSYSSWDDIYFISGDKDYNSCLFDETLNEYLLKEWITKADTRIHFFNRLSSFFKEKYPDIQFNEQIERQIFVKELCESRNFRETHKSVNDLFWEKGFSKIEFIKLFEALVNNGQINQIINDDDVKMFYTGLVTNGGKYLTGDLLNNVKQYIDVPDKEFYEDIPF